jgi:hypothetical protein
MAVYGAPTTQAPKSPKPPSIAGRAQALSNSASQTAAAASTKIVGPPRVKNAYRTAIADVAAAKAGTNARALAAAPKGANKLGKKAPGQTNWLGPLSQGQIVKEATKIVGSEYKPQQTDYNNQIEQAKALDAKRASDAKVYSGWLASQEAALATQNSSIMTNLESANTGIAAASGAALSNDALGGALAPGGIPGQPNPNSGAVNQGSVQAQFLNSDTDADKKLVGITDRTSNREAATGAEGLGEAELNAVSGLQNTRQSQIADLDTTLNKLRTSKTEAHQSQISDLAKEISALQTTEIQKAQYHQEFTEAQQKLAQGNRQFATDSQLKAAEINAGITEHQQSLDAEIAHYNQENTTENRRIGATAREELARLRQTRGNDTVANLLRSKEFQLAQRKENAAEAITQYEKTHNLTTSLNPRSKSGASGGLDRNEKDSAYGEVDQLRALMENLTTRDGYTPGQAYQIIKQGAQYTVNEGGKPHYENASQPTQQAYLDAAYNLLQQGSITHATLKKLNQLGIFGVRNRYTIGVQPPAPNPLAPKNPGNPLAIGP